MSRTLQQFDARRVARLSICGTSLCRKSGCGKSLQLFFLRSLMNQRLTSDVDHNEISARHHLLSSPSRAAYDPSVKSCSSGVSPLFSLQRAAARVLDTIDKAPSTDCALTGHLPARPVKMIFGRVGRFQESCPDMQLHPGSRRRLKGRAEIREAAAGNLGLALFFGCIAAADRERKKRLALHNMAKRAVLNLRHIAGQ
jgi:hypothetical protein